MLEVKVLNVGDGDAILVRLYDCNKSVFTVLIDTGRPFLEPSNTSKRREIMMHLEREAVSSINLLILTHLHIDHVGGAMSVLNHIPVESIVSTYFPPADCSWVSTPLSTEKSVLGLCQMLNFYSDIVSLATEKGTQFVKATTLPIYKINDLSISFILPNKEALLSQADLFDSLYHGESFSDDVLYRASKARNELSLMIDVRYAGRRILLCGDRYGYSFENCGIGKVDIVKVPHHGDKKSLTFDLVQEMLPQYAVISCENVYNEKKCRPDPNVISLLRNFTEQVYCTENCSFPGLEASSHSYISYQISPNGSINCFVE